MTFAWQGKKWPKWCCIEVTARDKLPPYYEAHLHTMKVYTTQPTNQPTNQPVRNEFCRFYEWLYFLSGNKLDNCCVERIFSGYDQFKIVHVFESNHFVISQHTAMMNFFNIKEVDLVWTYFHKPPQNWGIRSQDSTTEQSSPVHFFPWRAFFTFSKLTPSFLEQLNKELFNCGISSLLHAN